MSAATKKLIKVTLPRDGIGTSTQKRDWDVTSINLDLDQLLAKSGPPA